MPDTSNEKLEQNDALDIAGVLVASEQRTLLDAKVGDRILSGIQIDDEGHLIIREEEHLATLRGIANAASGNKPVLQSEDLLADRREDVFHWQDKLEPILCSVNILADAVKSQLCFGAPIIRTWVADKGQALKIKSRQTR